MRLSGLGCALRAVMLVCVCPAAARAVIVYSGARNVPIPNTPTGLFLNIIDGTTYTGPNAFPSVPGAGGNWDINPFGSAAWGFFVPNNGGQAAPIPVPNEQKGYVSVSPTGQVRNLPAGTIIGPSSVFNTQGPDADTIANGQAAIIGFRFRNETISPFTANYGWARVILTNGQPGTLVDWAYESVPATAIAAGAVPEPMGAGCVGMALAHLLARRRRQARRFT